MKKSLCIKIEEALENAGFNIRKIKETKAGYSVLASQLTPLGEEWEIKVWCDGTIDSFTSSVLEKKKKFNVNNEISRYVEVNWKDRIKDSTRSVIWDAEWKKIVLNSLVNELAA